MDGGQVQFSRYSNGMGNGQWGGRGGMNGHGGGINMGVMGMNGGVNGNMGQMNGRGPQGYQPPDQKRGLCRDYHSKSQSHFSYANTNQFAHKQATATVHGVNSANIVMAKKPSYHSYSR